MPNKSIFSYCISKTEISISELPNKKRFGQYYVQLDSRTPYIATENATCECAIFGLAVNVITGESEKLTEKVLSICANIQDVIEYEKQLGGKYIILYRNGEQYYIIGDATCSIPIFYSAGDDIICTSNCQYILNEKKYPLDCEYAKIRNAGDISQAMPYDITPYREIKQLIPNHYLSVNISKAIRFINASQKQAMITVQRATEIVQPMIEKIVNYYCSLYKIYCPITAGKDSRVVLSFLMQQKNPVACYTIKHPEHTDTTQDIVIPVELCRNNVLHHELIEDVVVPETLKNEMDALLGENNYSQRTLRIAQTIKEHYSDGAILTGDIVGQVGKCSLHRDIPGIFATPAYFRCKLHNYSSGAKKQLREWLQEIKSSGEKVNTFDLFSIENRMGQVSLNIFNSRSIIYIWTAVERKKRKCSLLHLALIKKVQPQLLLTPFESDESSIVKLSKATGILYLLSSYAKYCIERFKFEKQK